MCSMEKFLNYTGLKKLFVCRHPTMGLRVESVGRDFFYFGEGQSRSKDAFRYKLGRGKKESLSGTIVIMGSDKFLVNQRNEGIWFN